MNYFNWLELLGYNWLNGRVSQDRWAYTLILIDVPMAQSFKIYQTVLNKILYSRNAERDNKQEG